MTAAVAPGLAVSRACDSTDALPGLRPPDRVDGVAGTFGGVEGRRAAGAAPGGGGAAAAEPQAEAGLGGPDGDRRPGAAAPETVADEPAVRRVLKRLGIPPAPNRSRSTWRQFLRTQASTMLACDFFHVDCAVTLQRVYVSVTWNPSAEGPVGRRPSSPARIQIGRASCRERGER